MCHGVQSVRAKARRKLKCMSLRLAFYIRIELDRSNVDGRSFQAHPDKMLHFQGFAGFYRGYCKLPNFRTSLENTRQNGFFGIIDGSSQTVVKPLPLKRDRHNQTSLTVKICCLWERWRQCDLHRYQTIEKTFCGNGFYGGEFMNTKN